MLIESINLNTKKKFKLIIRLEHCSNEQQQQQQHQFKSLKQRK